MLAIYNPFLDIFFLSLATVAAIEVFLVNSESKLEHSFQSGRSQVVKFDSIYFFFAKIGKRSDMGKQVQWPHPNQFVGLLYQLIDKKMNVVNLEIFADINSTTMLPQQR